MTDAGWTRVGEAALWKRGRGRRVEVEGSPIAVFYDGSCWSALDDTCPHMGASLADGRLFGGELQCSWHEWRYDLATGRCPARTWARVRVHEVAVRDGAVYVRLAPGEAPRDAADDRDPDWLDWEPERYFRKRPDQGS